MLLAVSDWKKIGDSVKEGACFAIKFCTVLGDCEENEGCILGEGEGITVEFCSATFV